MITMSEKSEYRVTYWAPTEYEMTVEARTQAQAIEEVKRIVTEEMYEGDSLGFNSDEMGNFQVLGDR